MKRNTTMLRSLLVILFVLLLAALTIVGILAVDSAHGYPEYAHLAWPTYISILLGFVPVVLALWRMWKLASLVARDAAFTGATVMEIHRIKQYIVWFMAWFFVGSIAFRIAFGFVGPVVGAIWLLLEVAAAFLFAVVAILELLFASAVALREDAELTV